nr:hypothetical protein [Delftia acidovorans]
MTVLQQHPLSAAFPPLSDEEFQTLKDSIENLGVQNAITIYEGQVLDGWNRYCAAQELGFECPTREIEEHIDPREFVLSQNKARRHVTQAQLALATTAVYEWRPIGSNQHGGSALSAEAPKSTKELAEVAGVGVRTIEQAKAVQSSAVPEVVEAVRSGAMGLTKAAAIAKLPQDEQAQAIDKPVREIRAPVMPPLEDDPAPKVSSSQEPADPPPPEYSDLERAQDQIADLQAALALANLGSASEEDRQQAAELIASLQADVKSLQAQLRAVTSSRDFLLQENAQMKAQMAAQRREITRLKASESA